MAATLAPEDVRVGDFVAVLNETREYLSYFWDTDSMRSPNEPVRITWKTFDEGVPLKVKAVCLPFVFLKSANGSTFTRDLRQCQLVRLSNAYGEAVWKEWKKPKSNGKRKKKK